MITVKTPVMKLLTPLDGLVGDDLKKAKRDNGYLLNQSTNFTITDEYIKDAEKLFTVADMVDAMEEGGDVFNFWVNVKITTDNINNPTPVGLIDSIKVAVMSIPTEEDDEPFGPIELEAERQKTWYEWAGIGNANISVTEHEGYIYFGAHLGNTKRGCLRGSELMLIYNASDAELVESMPVIEEQVP